MTIEQWNEVAPRVAELRHYIHAHKFSSSGEADEATDEIASITGLTFTSLIDIIGDCESEDCSIENCADCDELTEKEENEAIENNNILIEEWLRSGDIDHDTEYAPSGVARLRLMESWERQ